MRMVMFALAVLVCGCAEEPDDNACSGSPCQMACQYEGHDHGYCSVGLGWSACNCCQCFESIEVSPHNLVGQYDGAPRCSDCLGI